MIKKGEKKMEIIRNSFLLTKFTEAVWLMRPDRLKNMSTILLNKFNNLEEYNKSLALLQLEDKKDSAINVQRIGNTAVLNIEGVMIPKCSWLDSMCGFVSTLELTAKFNELVEDQRIDKIINYFDTPGGETTAIMEFGEAIYNARNEKEIVTFTDTDMCSAGYWIGSSASEIVATPSSILGSIGVYIGVTKIKQPLKYEDGNEITISFIQAGDNKLFGSPYVELTQKEIDYFQERVNSTYEKFTSTVARNRGVSVEAVKETQASYYNAADAPKWMVDTLADSNYLFK